VLKEDGSHRARAGADRGAWGSIFGRLRIGATSGVGRRLGLSTLSARSGLWLAVGGLVLRGSVVVLAAHDGECGCMILIVGSRGGGLNNPD
jgi:hypothetical protein